MRSCRQQEEEHGARAAHRWPPSTGAGESTGSRCKRSQPWGSLGHVAACARRQGRAATQQSRKANKAAKSRNQNTEQQAESRADIIIKWNQAPNR